MLYLLGATSFRYPSVLRDRFARLAMTEALAAGLKEEDFPTQRIAEVTRTLIPDLREGRARIRGSSTTADRLWLADSNAPVFLSVLQSIPYQPQRDVFDWDHIFPQAKAGLMWSPGPGGRWRRHHKHRHLVGSAGNLWGLDAGANRAAQDLLPAAKFKKIETWSEDGGRRVWRRDRWWLTSKEIEQFSEIGSQLDGGDEVDSAMERFHDLVTARAMRMTDEVFGRLPEAQLFAADKSVAGADPVREPMIGDALGIEILEDDLNNRAPVGPSGADERVERVLRFADERGSGTTLREFVARALRLHLQVRGYQWTVTITPPTTKALALIAFTPHEHERGLVTTWVAPRAFAEHFPKIAPDRFDEEFGGIRGSLLDRAAIGSLAARLEALLATPTS